MEIKTSKGEGEEKALLCLSVTGNIQTKWEKQEITTVRTDKRDQAEVTQIRESRRAQSFAAPQPKTTTSENKMRDVN